MEGKLVPVYSTMKSNIIKCNVSTSIQKKEKWNYQMM